MTTAVEIIREEHRSMAAVLKSLLTHAQAAKAGKEPPDWPLYSAMLDYLQAFPEVTHHPKEDQFLFAAIRRKTSAADDALDTLQQQHLEGAERLGNLRSTLEQSRSTDRVSRFAEELEQYAEFQWQHMDIEERKILPLAIETLEAADWVLINAAFAANREPRW